MSAEKEIVNFWCNKRGFFTINNIKTSNNKDCGILALKFDDDGTSEMLHTEVSCSITSNISDAKGIDKSIRNIVDEKFGDRAIAAAIRGCTKQLSAQKSIIKKIIILGAFPKSRREEIIKRFNENEVEVIEFDSILYDVLENLDTQYYKNDIIRTLQLTKFLLLTEPNRLSKLLVNEAFSSNSRKEFLSSMLDNEDIIKEFKKTNSERLGAILKSSNMKPKELAEMVEKNVLNKRTRKMFLSSLMEQEKSRKILSKNNKVRKKNMALGKFF